MRKYKISEIVVKRLPLYLRCLTYLDKMGVPTISSHELGHKLGIKPSQIRKDLAYFGEFGKQGIGYDVSYLRGEIRHILGLTEHIKVAVVGAGKLGQALSDYILLKREDFDIAAVFDRDPAKIGMEVGGVKVSPIENLKEIIQEKEIQMAIVTVPANAAQKVVNLLVDAGVRGILSFAPIAVTVPEGVRFYNVDFTMELQSLAYYLTGQGKNEY
ncbi:MAG TPA: redox-sensing transcriptional repressor Rex [Clostridia bacterium]|nr:redox-sensing transcriptional repressor Rex [Clostridia bacterium]